MVDEYISRQYLLAEYDRQHQGPPGGARKIIAEAPAEDVVPICQTGCKGCKRENNFVVGSCSRCARFYKDMYCVTDEELTEQEKAELIKKEVLKEKEEGIIFFIVISIFIFILCGVSIIIN